MTFHLYVGLFLFLFVVIPSLASAVSNKGYLTPEEMADNVERGLNPDGSKRTKDVIERLNHDSLAMNHWRAQYEVAEKVIFERSTGQRNDGIKLKTKGKRNRIKWF